jgi:predicted nucleic acid-binding protein
LDVTEAAILDTGPLVAFLHANEQHHGWVVDRLRELPPRFLTCEAVLTECCFLLGFDSRAVEQIDEWLERGVIRLPFQFLPERQRVMRLMHAYQKLPMSFADACLVRMSELYPHLPVFTLDKDFLVYRKNGRQRIETIMPA